MKKYHDLLYSAKRYVEVFALQFNISNTGDYERGETFIRKLIITRNWKKGLKYRPFF